ncbi:hypothetical protein CDL15_Pgr010119 [Punica granatum]|uniref:Uncharacterized protein n=1 Tax=Punica granatum TaxID=22663 RepID=A0A218VTZ5_PUNGR|nr:hypothetical protein CDL15_Pgr010119 [Punica granatum]
MWESSFRVERLRVPRDRESESVVVPAFVGNQSLSHPNFISSGHACARLSKRGLGVSTFPWGCATDTREKESPLTVYDP